MWRALKNILPTRSNLLPKTVLGSYICPLCEQASKTVKHVLCNCSATNDIWFFNPLNVQKWPKIMDDLGQQWNKVTLSFEGKDMG